MKTILLIILLTLSSTAKDYDCKKLLSRAVTDLNHANKHKHIDVASQYAVRSLANSNMYTLCVELHEDFSIDKTKKMIRRLK